MLIEGKVALITGAARGIGKSLGEELLKRGAKGVSLLDIDDSEGETALSSLSADYGEGKVIFLQCDVACQSDLKAAFRKTKEHFGQIDIVCNNAMTYNDNDVSTFIEVLLSAAIRGTYLGVDFMGKTNGGNGGLVINTGSMAGLWPVPIIPCYCAAKAGLIHFTRSAAEEPMLQQNGVRINVICLDNVDVGPHRFDAMKRFKYGQILENVTKERKSLSLSEAVSGFIRVIEDESLNGSVVSLLVDKGYEVMEFPEITMS